MTGDLTDIVSRLWAVLPKRWFAEHSPNLEAVLTCLATPWVRVYKLIRYVIMQTRLRTATDMWLDLIAVDYFGRKLPRRSNEVDLTYRARIQTALLRGAATRSAVSAGLESLIGTKPVIFEPANCMDTGGYGGLAVNPNMPGSGLAYGQAGGWGSLGLPYQFFVTVARSPAPGVGLLAGWGTSGGGYGEGALGYVDLSLFPGHVTDQDIQSTLCSVLPVNAVAWLRIN